MVENTQNSFKGYISLFTFYILLINYAIFVCQILIFGPNWVQDTIVHFKILNFFSYILISVNQISLCPLKIIFDKFWIKNNFLRAYFDIKQKKNKIFSTVYIYTHLSNQKFENLTMNIGIIELLPWIDQETLFQKWIQNIHTCFLSSFKLIFSLPNIP